MSVFDTAPPDFSEAELAEIARQYFGLSGRLRTLDSERDQNAHIACDGAGYVLKVANPAEDLGFLEMQNALLRHIAGADAGLAVSRVVPGLSGRDIVLHRHGRLTYAVRLLTYLDGDLFSTAEKSAELYASLGDFMGRFSAAMQGFDHPKAHRPDFLWNLDGAPGCRKYTADIRDGRHKSRIEKVFDRYQARTLPRLAGLRQSVLHQDANDNNLIVDATDHSRVVGIVDFGDVVYGRQVNELAITLAYVLLQAPDMMVAARSLIDGYTERFPLTADERDVLIDLAAMRLAMSVCISSHRAKEFPENEYLLVSQASALRALKRLGEVPWGRL